MAFPHALPSSLERAENILINGVWVSKRTCGISPALANELIGKTWMPTVTFFGYYVSQDVTRGGKIKTKQNKKKRSVATTYRMCKFTTAAECWLDFFLQIATKKCFFGKLQSSNI